MIDFDYSINNGKVIGINILTSSIYHVGSYIRRYSESVWVMRSGNIPVITFNKNLYTQLEIEYTKLLRINKLKRIL